LHFREGIRCTGFFHQRWMELNDQLHALTALSPENESPVPVEWKAGWIPEAVLTLGWRQLFASAEGHTTFSWLSSAYSNHHTNSTPQTVTALCFISTLLGSEWSVIGFVSFHLLDLVQDSTACEAV
jgi:hypothetical protein